MSSAINAESPDGIGALQQIVFGVCPGERYDVFAYIGQSNNIVPGSTRGVTTTEGSFYSVPLLTPFFPFTAEFPCPLLEGSGPYGLLDPNFIAPTSSTPPLKSTIRKTVDSTIFSLDVFIDKVEIKRAL